MEQDFSMHANPLVAKLQKPASEFTKADIVSYIKENGITMVNFMYPAADGRLKTLNFVINDAAYLDAILTCGERVDGSSLFPFIEAGSSDLYVIPRFCTAFIDPFAEQPTLSMLCSFFNKDGEPLANWSIPSFRKTAVCSRLPTSVVITSLLRMPSSMNSVPSVWRTSHKPADKLSTGIPKWVTSPLTARYTSRMKSNFCRYVPSRQPTS